MDGKLSGNHREEFTRDGVSSMKVHTMYPTTEEKQKIASLIIQKYSFLADSIGAATVSLTLVTLYVRTYISPQLLITLMHF